MQLLAKLSHGELQQLLTAGLLVLGTIAITVPVVVAVQWRWMREATINAEIKRDMLARGLSAEDIERVVWAGAGDSNPAGGVPCSGEVVVESNDEWHSAIVLKRDESRWYVHFVGTDLSENEWVSADRIRFPITYFESASMNGSGPIEEPHRGREALPGRYAKPVPVDHDLA